jgi:L-aminopeptidase/D-esterase
MLKEITLNEISNFLYGQVEDKKGMTGCTVVLCPTGAMASVSVRGGGPASHETELLKPENTIQKIHSVVLSGGSAYGLEATSGVMKYLEERNIGFSIGKGVVPIVCGASIFDLNVGSFHTRPNKEMGYRACLEAEKKENLKNGNFGAGTGATVGKILGMEHGMKGGIGTYALQLGELKVGAIVVVNAMGDIFDRKTGLQIAGPLSEDKNSLQSTQKIMYENYSKINNNSSLKNTTIACIVSNADISKTEAYRVATLAHNAFAKVINPVHTSLDGDTIFMLANGDVKTDIDTLATFSVEVLSEAINRAIYSAEEIEGYPSWKSLHK